jgi:hypothetical protein
MSSLLTRALEAADLDLLVLGALADRMRDLGRSEIVRVHLDPPTSEVRTFGRSELEAAGDGHAFVRKIALARIAEPRAPLRVDADAVGLPIAQVALAFGADEIVVAKSQLEVYAEGDPSARERAILREREIAALVRAAGRRPRIVEWREGVAVERDPDETSDARRRFRAPGRDAKALPVVQHRTAERSITEREEEA